jgi:AcrR family transcriptional regulator
MTIAQLKQRSAGRRLSRIGTTKSRVEPEKKPTARHLILDAAEELFGEHGINAVSLREIGAAAGQRNNNAVRYHFGDKDQLVRELLSERIAQVEVMREQMVREMGDLSRYGLEDLLRVLWRPLTDLSIRSGHHCFIRFLLAYQVQTGGAAHPISVDPLHHKTSDQLMTAIYDQLSHVPIERLRYRMSLVAMMFWAAVAQHDHALLSKNKRWSKNFSFDETLAMACSALNAPV